MRSHNSYAVPFPNGVDASAAAATHIVPCYDGGRVEEVLVTHEVALTGADEALTLSVRNAAGTAVAITGGVLTVDQATSALGKTEVFTIGPNSDGTDVVPPGGSLQMVNDTGATVGILHVTAVLRR